MGSLTHPDHTDLRGTWLTDAEVLLGNYYPSFSSRSRGFVYDGRTWTDGLIPGTNWGYTSGINNVAAIIGTQVHENRTDRYGFVLDGTNYESFPYPGWSGWTSLQDINDAGVLAGSAVGAVPLGTFSVAIDAVPTLTVSGTTFATVGETVLLTLGATSSFPSDPADTFTFDIDWENDGTYDERISGTTGTQVSHVYAAGGTYVIGVRSIRISNPSQPRTRSKSPAVETMSAPVPADDGTAVEDDSLPSTAELVTGPPTEAVAFVSAIFDNSAQGLLNSTTFAMASLT